ncbi:MAG: ArsR/SmtB family transcription factor, partial [Promethearchaeota archaeon]
MNELTKFSIEFLRILSDQTRLEILELLRDGPKTSKEIQIQLNKSQPTISQHLKNLQGSNLIDINLMENENNKRLKYYSIKDKDLFKLLSTIYSYVA